MYVNIAKSRENINIIKSGKTTGRKVGIACFKREILDFKHAVIIDMCVFKGKLHNLLHRLTRAELVTPDI